MKNPGGGRGSGERILLLLFVFQKESVADTA